MRREEGVRGGSYVHGDAREEARGSQRPRRRRRDPPVHRGGGGAPGAGGRDHIRVDGVLSVARVHVRLRDRGARQVAQARGRHVPVARDNVNRAHQDRGELAEAGRVRGQLPRVGRVRGRHQGPLRRGHERADGDFRRGAAGVFPQHLRVGGHSPEPGARQGVRDLRLGFAPRHPRGHRESGRAVRAEDPRVRTRGTVRGWSLRGVVRRLLSRLGRHPVRKRRRLDHGAGCQRRHALGPTGVLPLPGRLRRGRRAHRGQARDAAEEGEPATVRRSPHVAPGRRL
mmetsp:Transcript_10830/g.45110  ORF Transcript_10830/g.45110 Transcript_10830/m.45110 type:complete len:284 (-) Transcript_10830:1172-2023(-)